MVFALAPEAATAGHRLAAFDTIGSTSQEAMDRTRAGERGPLWVVSAAQSAGRGRRGSIWQTPTGNLAASLLLTTRAPPARLATLGFVAGLALHRALVTCCDGASGAGPRSENTTRFRLKWPNDVLVDGAKLAGILLETEEIPDGRAVVIGIGVNVASTPLDAPYPVASLAGLGHEVTAEELFTVLSAAWLDAASSWSAGGGFAALRERWLSRAAGLGDAVAVQTPSGTTHGVFETIDDSGRLVIRVPDGSARTVSAGEVHFGVAASAPSEMRA